MRVTVFPSGKGDCLLLQASSGEYVLVDGGTRDAYRRHVAVAMGTLRRRKAEISLSMVSHSDSDHIAGILQLLDDEVQWRVHDYQRSHRNPKHARPERPRPPVIRELWLNGFGEQLGEDAARAASVLDRTATILSAASDRRTREAALDTRQIAQSIPEALRVARRVGAHQLGVPVNRGFSSGLVVVGPKAVRKRIGSLELRILGPRQVDLDRYREAWRKWLRANESTLEQLRRQAAADEASLSQGEADRLLATLRANADALGDRTKVTPPNLASIMVLAQDGSQRVLLTGDGHGDDLLAGLQASSLLDGNGALHVDVLKVQHHGSEKNITEAFARAVTADHYVFCGNGEHENPDLRVVRLIAASRIGGPSDRSEHPDAARPFTFWFNTSPATTRESAVKHVRALERQVRTLARGSGGRMTYRFAGDARFTIGARVSQLSPH
jgi:beta-lactamase superfamily II metal-dependent hydrolase